MRSNQVGEETVIAFVYNGVRTAVGEEIPPQDGQKRNGRVASSYGQYTQKNRTLVQFSNVFYNGSYFDQKGCADELIKDAPGARSPPKRKKPVVSTPLVAPGKYSLALVGPLHKGHRTERYRYINRSDDSICCLKSLEKLVLFPWFFTDIPTKKHGSSQNSLKADALRWFSNQLLPYAIRSLATHFFIVMKEGFVWIL